MGDFIGKKFEGNEPTKLGVFGFVDDTHPAPAEFLDDAVMRDGLPDHWARILVSEVRQVNESVVGVNVLNRQFETSLSLIADSLSVPSLARQLVPLPRVPPTEMQIAVAAGKLIKRCPCRTR